MQYFEEIYVFLDDFCVERGYDINEGEGASVVPSIIDDESSIVPALFYNDFFLEEAHNIPKIFDSPLKGDNEYVDGFLLEEKVYVDACFNETHQYVVITNFCLNKINPNVCNICDKVVAIEDSHQGEKEYVVFYPKVKKDKKNMIYVSLKNHML